MKAGVRFKPGRYLLLGACWLFACRSTETIQEVKSVPLKITAAEPLAGGDPKARTWLVTCGQERFLMDLVIPSVDPNEPIQFTTGRLCRHQETDARQCLDSIARVLEAKQVEAPHERSQCLPFQAAILGQNLNDHLVSAPRGTWLATKAFVAGGEGEFYMNLSPETGEGEISIKDPEFGNIVVRELAKVMAGPG
jgi:hypothetical protein